MINFAPNQKYLIDYGPNNPNTEIIHIRAVVDGVMIVFRTWQKHKQHWEYEVENFHYFEMLNKNGQLKKR